MSEPFPFIVGCGRSGTTLLRAMVDAHPEMTVPPESHFIVALAPGRGGFDPRALVDRLAADERFRLWGLDRPTLENAILDPPASDYPSAVRAVFATWAARQGKARYADKTPGYVLHIPALARLFPESVFIHLVRDGRDVAASFLDLGWADSIESAAFHWRLRVGRGRRAGRGLGPGRYHELRYEDLVSDPEAALRPLCGVLGVSFAPEMLEHHRRAAAVVRTTNHPAYHRNLTAPLTADLRNWRRDLGTEQVARFELVAGRLLTDLGYEPADGRPPARVRIEVAGRWARWQLHRVNRRFGSRARAAIDHTHPRRGNS
jgi:Sulfotransferase family